MIHSRVGSANAPKIAARRFLSGRPAFVIVLICPQIPATAHLLCGARHGAAGSSITDRLDRGAGSGTPSGGLRRTGPQRAMLVKKR